MWVLDADLSFARVHCVKIVDTMGVLAADSSFARVHYDTIILSMWVLDADLSFARVHYFKETTQCGCWIQTQASPGPVTSQY